MPPIERASQAPEPYGLPSPEAIQLANNFLLRRYALPETLQHPEVRSECLRLAYMIQAYGLAVPHPPPTPGKRRPAGTAHLGAPQRRRARTPATTEPGHRMAVWDTWLRGAEAAIAEAEESDDAPIWQDA